MDWADLGDSMDDARFSQLAAFYAGGDPLDEAAVRRVERAVGPVPPVIRRLWRELGPGRFESPELTLDLQPPSAVPDAASALADRLSGLVPFADDGAGAEFCWVHADATEPGLVPGSVLAVTAGETHWASAVPCGRDDADFFQRLMLGHDPFELPNLGQHWSEAHRAMAAMPAGLSPDQVQVVSLHYRLLSPRELRLRERAEVAGVACKAGSRVVLDPAGQPVALTPAADVRLLGMPCRAGAEVVLGPRGLARFVPAAPVTLGGVRWAAGGLVTLPDALDAGYTGTLAEPTTVDGLPLAAAPARIDAQGRVLAGTLAEPAVVDGVALPASARFERMTDAAGALRLFAARAPVAWRVGDRAVEPGERFYPGTAR